MGRGPLNGFDHGCGIGNRRSDSPVRAAAARVSPELQGALIRETCGEQIKVRVHRATLPPRCEFALLKPWLTGQPADHTQVDVARALGLNEGAVRVRIHRLRRRFRDLVKAEIAQTVRDPAEVGDELRYLIAVLT
jgi:hypothetical protein